MKKETPERSVEEWEKEFDSFFEVYTATDKYGKRVGTWNAPDVFTMKNFIRSTLKTERQKREEVVEYLTSTEPAPDTETYIDLVKNGNKDDMYDYGVKLMRDMCIKALTQPNNK